MGFVTKDDGWRISDERDLLHSAYWCTVEPAGTYPAMLYLAYAMITRRAVGLSE